MTMKILIWPINLWQICICHNLTFFVFQHWSWAYTYDMYICVNLGSIGPKLPNQKLHDWHYNACITDKPHEFPSFLYLDRLDCLSMSTHSLSWNAQNTHHLIISIFLWIKYELYCIHEVIIHSGHSQCSNTMRKKYSMLFVLAYSGRYDYYTWLLYLSPLLVLLCSPNHKMSYNMYNVKMPPKVHIFAH